MRDIDKKTDGDRGSFTLLELLIVISVIALLSALLLPALAKARESGKASLCLSNQRQSGMALMSYAQDYQGYLPLARENIGGWKGWAWVLFNNNCGPKAEIGKPAIYVCPSCPDYVWTSSNQLGYGLNRTWGDYRTRLGPPIRVGYNNRVITDMASSFPLLADSVHTNASGGVDKTQSFAFYQTAYSGAMFSYPSMQIGGRHQRGYNLLFADGHAERLSKAVLIKDYYFEIDNFQ